MKHPEYQAEMYFVEFLLRSYLNDKIVFPKSILNLEPLSVAVAAFLRHYEFEDVKRETQHMEEIKAIFITKEINGLNCETMGFSPKTYYRHKLRYLKKFQYFLSREIGAFHIE